MPAKTMEEIAELLSAVRFKRKLLGGVDEAHVWRVLEKLQGEYRSLLEAQQERADARLKEREALIREQNAELRRLREKTRDASDREAKA